MSSDYKEPLTEGQKEILRSMPRVPLSQAIAMVMGQNENRGDETDLSYSLNMAQTHASILCQEAERWKQRAQRLDSLARRALMLMDANAVFESDERRQLLNDLREALGKEKP